MELTLDDIIEHLGQPRTKIGGELIWQCPICMDKSKDNLHYNEKKNILWCFANDEHNKMILSEISKKKHEKEKMYNAEIPRYVKPEIQNQFLHYMELCNDMLLGRLNEAFLFNMVTMKMYKEEEAIKLIKISQSDKPQKAREYLKSKIGINTRTIELTGLGFDFDTNRWVFPIFNMDNALVGFEYRYKDLKQKKIWREEGTPRCMANIYGTGKNAYICEGYKDGYLLMQILEYHNMLDDSTILTSSNGVSHTLHVISQLQFNKYDNIYLCLDNDKIKEKIIKNGIPQDASRQMTKKIIEKYPFIKDRTPKFTDEELEQGYKDIADVWMLKYNKKKEV